MQRSSVSALISTAGNLILMYFGIRQVIDGNLTLGSLMAFTTMAGSFKMTWASFLSDFVKSVSFSILSRMLELILNQLCY